MTHVTPQEIALVLFFSTAIVGMFYYSFKDDREFF